MSSPTNDEESRLAEIPSLPNENSSFWMKAVLLLGALGCFVLGILGAILPGLPATPFLLLTSFLLVRSSPRLNALLLKSKLFGPILHDWQVKGGVRRDIKLRAAIVVVIMVGVSVWMSNGSTWLMTSVVVLASVGLIVIAKLPIPSPEKTGEESTESNPRSRR